MAAPPDMNAFAAAMAPPRQLSAEEAKAAITDVTHLLEVKENVEKLTAAKDAAGEDMMAMMMMVMPVAISIVSPVLTKYGFSPDQMGAMQFLAALRAHEGNEDIRAMAATMKEKFLPPQLQAMAAAMTGAMGGGGMMPPPAM